ncbi:MAG TPA: redoxin domain-containing protein [Pyrinomonadaceae bacterium]|nr:redoxin domain-containing protein [Pyrinomonadaceae bacterium]
MKTFFILALMLLSLTFAQAQGEQAPLQEKEFEYKNWTYKSVRDDQSINLRDFAKDKKLVMVVYFSAWCPNWRNEAPVAQRLYEKYKDHGFVVVGVSEYETVEKTLKDLEKKGIAFPVVYESVSLQDREKTLHFGYRKEAGDTRKWGSPWNVFFVPSKMKKDGDTLVKKAFVVNGELIEAEVEKFIREKLGLKPEEAAAQKIQ